jgi:hypothetical protein
MGFNSGLKGLSLLVGTFVSCSIIPAGNKQVSDFFQRPKLPIYSPSESASLTLSK